MAIQDSICCATFMIDQQNEIPLVQASPIYLFGLFAFHMQHQKEIWETLCTGNQGWPHCFYSKTLILKKTNDD